MRRVLIVYNLRSSRFKDVKAEVLDVLSDPAAMHKMGLNGVMVGKYEVKRTNIEDNVAQLAKVIRDGDLLLAVGGDATAAIAANSILTASKDATLAVLPYGNFNDLARTLKTKKLKDVFSSKAAKLWPLEIMVDGEHFRFATCYVTIGMMAEATELFDNKKVRKHLQKGRKSSWRSYPQLAGWYFKNRHKKVFLPEFSLNGNLQPKKTSDYTAVNGRLMAKVMKGGMWFLGSENFWSGTGRLTNFFRLSNLMAKSILHRVPGKTTKRDVLEFVEPARVEIQAEGEYKLFENVNKIEIKKAKQYLKVIINL